VLSLVVIDGLEATAGAEVAVPSFERFVETTGARLRVALVARYGVEVGVDACADALAYAWEHWDRVSVMDNAAGYLFRVGQTSARRQVRWRRHPALPPERSTADEGHGDDIGYLLGRLDERQRVAVVLAHVYGWTYADIADLLDVSHATVRNLIHRGLAKLRRSTEKHREH
jgi:RNA polymerase sigma-70 factor (ECF subfamily)